ncbi:hypothetical protein ACHAWU_007480 [Discostella pseudostelligera]|uniref:Uncharacterized protein n=1 Tax=Discostella pseudostelligera TaxID=259834 RepID=A0ABD3MR44_9STRA
MADDDSSTSSDSLSSNEEQSHSTSTNTTVDATSTKEMDKIENTNVKNNDDDDDDDDDEVVADGVVADINDGYDDDDSRKIFLSRIPQSFNEEIITRILETKFGVGCVVNVSIVHDKQQIHENDNGGGNDTDKKKMKSGMKHDEQQRLPHRGFAFVTFISTTKYQEAILAGTVRGSAKMNTNTSTTSKRKHTMYIRPVLRDDDTSNHATKHNDNRNKYSEDGKNSKDICFLWKKHRCPYGDGCKFVHVGEGGCAVVNSTSTPNVKHDGDGDGDATGTSSKKKHCFNFKKSGKCKAGDDCPFLHDINVTTTKTKHREEEGAEVGKQKDKSQIMCINWKNKGKCRKGEKCPYRHGNSNDPIRGTVVVGKEEGKVANEEIDDGVQTTADTKEKKRKRKENKQRQSLSIRIFGLNYNTTPDDVRTLLQQCGPIMELTFPTFEDSGRSKGYCGVLFQSPKAVEKAILLDGCELHDRWLRIQEGKMFLKKWEEVENDRRKEQGWGTNDDDETEEKDGRNATIDEKEKIVLGEFGQRVKKRKKHGYKD